MYIGIDGGGTKTAGVVVAHNGHLLARLQVGSTNPNAVGETAARSRLAELIHTLLTEAGAVRDQVQGIGLGMSGVGRPADRERVRRWVAELLPGVPCIVDNDAVIALAAATGGELCGVVVVSGTGMIVMGIDAEGQRRRAGGWGPIIGEPGGGFALGAAALRAIAEAEDGLRPPTTLTAAVLGHLGLQTAQDLVAWTYADLTWARFAALAPVVMQCAQAGDAAAQLIVEEAAEALAQAAGAVIGGLEFGSRTFPIVLTGGNLQPGRLADALTLRLRQRWPQATAMWASVDPAVGAALLVQRNSA